jgi:Flp pilus assembly protein TadG
MKKNSESFVRVVRDGQRGQTLAMVALLLPVILGMAALIIDLGYIYVSYQQLVSATQAAALAGGSAIPNASGPTATTFAQDYSASKLGAIKDLNYHPNLQSVSTTVNLACVSQSSYPTLALPPCNIYPSCPSGCNMLQVTSTAKVPTMFAKIFGINSVNISATAVASARGGGIPPYHIMVVLDTTASMGMGLDTGCTQNGTSVTPEQCAQYGVQTLLLQLDPCALGQAACQPNLGSPGSVKNPVDQVGLMVFPGLCNSSTAGYNNTNKPCPQLPTGSALTNTTVNANYAPADETCPAGVPTQTSYNNNPDYLILGFQGNYRSSDTAPLNTASNLFHAIGAGTNSCGVSTPAVYYTFYAGALQAAQDYLSQNNVSGVQNVIIFLSDGDANSPTLAGNVKQADGPSAGATYLATNECQQAVQAANWAKTQTPPTLIYSISYGSETTGCSTDTAASSVRTPCATMQGISSTPLSQYFFSVPMNDPSNPTETTVCANAVPLTALNQVFTTIAGQLTVARLVPSGDF